MIKRLGAAFVLSLIPGLALSEPMQFVPGGDDTRCAECGFIQAFGEIVQDTPQSFEKFINSVPDYAPKRLRINSPGGNLLAGIRLGEMLRAGGFATEVGFDLLDHGAHPAFGNRASKRIPGICASACAYMFLGGVERTISAGSKFGVH